MSEPVKYTFRGIGLFFVLFVLLPLATIGFGSLIIGVIVTILSWLPIIESDFLIRNRILFLNQRIMDSSSAFILFFTTGVTLIAVGVIVLVFGFYLYKSAQILDQDLSKTVDTNLPSIKIIFSRKGKAIFILAIMLFGSFIVFLSLIFP
ncbi:MAG: hypothetical protein ACW98X_25810 [Promethearchaeota archaeon]|jgi:hypothetical protein